MGLMSRRRLFARVMQWAIRLAEWMETEKEQTEVEVGAGPTWDGGAGGFGLQWTPSCPCYRRAAAGGPENPHPASRCSLLDSSPADAGCTMCCIRSVTRSDNPQRLRTAALLSTCFCSGRFFRLDSVVIQLDPGQRASAHD